MKIFKDIRNSIYNPSFYSDKKDEAAKTSFVYFLKLKLIESVILTIIFSIIIVPAFIIITSKSSVEKVVNLFPDGLTVTIKDGKAYTNVAEPYIVPTKSEKDAHKNILVIDTKSVFDMDLFSTSDTSILLTKEYIVGEKSNGQITIQSLKDIPNVELNRAKINDWMNIIIPYVKYVLPVFILIYFVFLLISNIVGSLILILFTSFIIWCVAKIRKSQEHSFKQIYKLGFYCITPLVIMDIILYIFGINMFWYVSTIIYLIFFYINVKDKKEIVVISNPVV